MSSCLQNVYAYLVSKKTEDYNVMLCEPLSYLKKLTGDNKDTIIFVYKKSENANVNFQELTPNKFKNLHQNDIDLDLTGSPLKDNCDIDPFDLSFDLPLENVNLWSKAEELYQSIKLDTARSIISDINLQCNKEKSCGALWFLCDATDQDKTVLFNLNFENGYNSVGLIKFKGLICPKDVNSSELVATHYSLIKGTNKVNTTIDIFYNIKPHITLKLNWNTSSHRPALVNTKNSDCTLFQNIEVNNNDSLAEDFYRQLKILNIIKKDIIRFKKTESNDNLYKCGSEINIEKLREKIILAMTEFSEYYEPENNNDIVEIEAVVLIAKKRPYINLTDKLWDILKSCGSYKNLKIAWNIVFQCAVQRNIVNMPTNQNGVAEIIREVSQRRLAIPCLTGSEPLELLLEIGLEKLHKDYEYIFTESKICSSSDLQITKNGNLPAKLTEPNLNVRNTLHNAMKIDNMQSSSKTRKTLLHSNNNEILENNIEIVGFQNSQFNEKHVEFQLAKLVQIHLILEHLLSIQIHLNLKNVYHRICQQLLQKPPVPFDEIENSKYDKICISLMSDTILQHIENKDAHSKKITMFSENKFREVKSTFYFNMENIFPPNTFPDLMTNDTEMSKESMYFQWNFIKIKTRRN